MSVQWDVAMGKIIHNQRIKIKRLEQEVARRDALIAKMNAYRSGEREIVVERERKLNRRCELHKQGRRAGRRYARRLQKKIKEITDDTS